MFRKSQPSGSTTTEKTTHQQQSPRTISLDSVDSNVKASLIIRLKECVSEIVMKYTAESWIPLKNEEATNMLCWILEAVFIHGLKNTFIKSLFSSRRENSIPNPSFWEFVMVFTHRDVIEQIRKLNYVNNDVGRSRAWIRITLNEMSLVSYLENMFRNPSYVRNFYKPSAFLRDSEKCDILKNYLVGVVESCKFDLVVDNSLLNQWTSGPLSLVGLWMDDNISQGFDVASNMDSKDLQTIPQLGKAKNPVPDFVTALRRQPLLAEEDALRIIMASKPSSSSATSSRRNSFDSNKSGGPSSIGNCNYSTGGVGGFGSNKIPEAIEQDQSTEFANTIPKPISIKTRKGTTQITNDDEIKNSQKQIIPISVPPPPFEQKLSQLVDDELKITTMMSQVQRNTEAIDIVHQQEQQPQMISQIYPNDDAFVMKRMNSEELSYMEILTAYNKEKKIGAEIYGGSPMDSHLEELMMKTATTSDMMGSEKATSTSSVEIESEILRIDGFELISSFNSNKNSSDMYPRIKEFVGKIANEIGMDVQQYCCKFCRAPIGMSFAVARVCHFTGNYFCTSCHVQDMDIIPSRILLNWDFSLYSVCKLSHLFLEEINDQPLFDLDRINPKLYCFIDELTELRDLRTKLNYVSMYLKTCKDETVFEDFRNELSPREYLFETVHRYSLSDLLCVTNRTLIIPLNKLLKFGISHIISCKICLAKGFVCEICKNPEVIFPFQLDSTFKCRSCGAVYHSKCMSLSLPCPRCQRWKNNTIQDNICDDDDVDIDDDDHNS